MSESPSEFSMAEEPRVSLKKISPKAAVVLDFLSKIQKANKELTKKEMLKDLLHRLYAGDKEINALIDKISRGAETTVLNIPRKDKLHRGSADTL